MRERIHAFIIVMVVLASGSAAFSQQTITLENSELKVSLSPENATLMSVVKKQANASYLGSSEQAGWFRIQIPLPHWDGHSAASRDLTSVTVEQHGSEAVEIQTKHMTAQDDEYAVPATLLLRLEGENLVCRLSFQNDTERTIDSVTFPILDVPPSANGADMILMPNLTWPLRMVFSKNQIRTAHDPFETLDPLDVLVL